MKNTDYLADYQKNLGEDTTKELWNIFKSETREGLYEQLSRWVLQKEIELLKNFFHSRQSGAKVFQMPEFTQYCRQMEEHLSAGGGVEIVNSRLSKIAEVFEKEANKTELSLNKKGQNQ